MLNRISADARAILALAGAVVATFYDVVLGLGGFFRSDLAAYHRPLKWVWASTVRSGHFPWWNPLISGGQPMAANPAYETFYPLQLPLLLPGFDYWFDMHILMHVVLAGAGMYLLLRSHGYRASVSFLIALTFELSGPVLATMTRLPFLFAIAWVPWIVLFTRRYLHSKRAAHAALAAMSFGMQALVGEPMTVLQTALLVLGYALARGWDSGRLRGAVREMTFVLVIGILGALLAAVQLVPGIAHARESVRADGFEWRDASSWSTPPVRLAELAWPALFRVLGDEEGFQRVSVMYPARLEGYLIELYVGLLVIVCAIVGMISGARRRWLLLAATAGFTILALGTTFPLFRWLWEIGVFRSIRYPEKFLLGAIFPIFLLAAAGLEAIAAGKRARARAAAATAGWLVIAVSIYANADAVPMLSGVASDLEIAAWPLDRWIGINVLRGAILIAILMYGFGRSTRTWVVALTLFTVLDLLFVNLRHTPRESTEWFRAPAVASEERSGRIVSAAARADMEGTVPEWVFDWGNSWSITRTSMYPYRNLRWGIPSLLEEDIDGTVLQTTAELNRAIHNARQRTGSWPFEILAASGVGALVRYNQSPMPAGGSLVHLSPIPGDSVYWFANDVVLAPDAATLTDLVARGRISRYTATVPRALPDPAAGQLISVETTPARVRMRVSSEGESLLVAAITRHPAWRVSIDGREVETLPVHLAWQGIRVPPGAHLIEMRYRDRTVIYGAMISLLTLLGIAAVMVVPRRGRTRASADPEG